LIQNKEIWFEGGGKVFTLQQFLENILHDFKKEFPQVELGERYIRLSTGITHAELPISTMYKEYQIIGYDNTKRMYIEVANGILSQYKFKINYNNVFPLLKSMEFGNEKKDLGFYREHAFADIDILYVTDEGEVFRYVLNTDDVDFDKMKRAAWENINKITNPLVKLDKILDIFCLKYSTDYNSTLLLSDWIQNQIRKKIGPDYLFAIPSQTTLIIARCRLEYIKIIESLIMIDNDPNKVSDKVYSFRNGIFDIESG
jgi:uncharacterized protein YtpQ (UPF0354 family)